MPLELVGTRLAETFVVATIALVFDTESGSTNRVAKMIAGAFPDGAVDLFSAAQLNADTLAPYSALVFGSPSMQHGRLADNWQFFVESDGIDLTGKTVALFGLGDQVGYPREFVDGLGVLYERVKELGATVVGSWPTEGYTFKSSRAMVDGQFVGLVIDEDNQADLTKPRIDAWVAAVRGPLASTGSP